MREPKEVNLTDWKERLVGLEFENPLVDQAGTFISHIDINNFWKHFLTKKDTKTVDYFTKVVIGGNKKLKNKSTETLDTDTSISSIEMSLRPQANLHKAKEAYEEIRSRVLVSTMKFNVRFLGYATIPGRIQGEIAQYKSRKSLYRVLRYPRHDFVMPITAHQTGVSVRSSELLEAVNILQALSGAVVCLVANSPIFDGKVTPWKEVRLACWKFRSTSSLSEKEKRVFPEMRSKPFSTLAEYINYIWAGDMLIPVMRKGQWVIPNEKMSFVKYFQGTAWAGRDLFGQEVELTPSVSDINFASICSWHDIKPHFFLNDKQANVTDFMKHLENDTLDVYISDKLINCYVEYRIGATAPIAEEMALPALTLGIINNLEAARELVYQYSWHKWQQLRENSYITAMQSTIGNDKIIPVLEKLVTVAKDGLKKRNMGEERYLNPIYRRIAERKSPADKCLEVFKRKGMRGFLDHVTYVN